jgi:leader peptidase (prepilin peptidase) / N-methyltransferase
MPVMVFDFQQFSREFPWFFPIGVFLVGACVGSFLNVVIYRVPKEESIVTPGSHCGCGQPIKWQDNIPILSWIALRGRARCCGRAFSVRYPFVELLTAGLFLLCWTRFTPAVAACGWVFLACLIAATFIDLDHMIIPDVFTIGLAIVGVILSACVPALHHQHGDFFMLQSFRATVASLQGLLIGSGVVLWIAVLAETVLRKEAMGFGDVKFIGAIGAFCGWQGAVFAVFGGAVVGTVWFAVAWTWQRITGKAAPVAPPSETAEGEPVELGFGAHVPFGPMLAIAGALYFLLFRDAVTAWFDQMGAML